MSGWKFVSTSGGCSATQMEAGNFLTLSLTNVGCEAPKNGETVFLTSLVGEEEELSGYLRTFRGPLSVTQAKLYVSLRLERIRMASIKVARYYGVKV